MDTPIKVSMKSNKISYLVLAVEIAAIIYLHAAQSDRRNPQEFPGQSAASIQVAMPAWAVHPLLH